MWYDKAAFVALLTAGALIASMALPIDTETWRGPSRQVLVARYTARIVVGQALRYQQIFGRNPGGLARMNADLPDVQVPEADPWGRPWVLSPAFEDPQTSPWSGDLWVCSRGPSGTGPCPPPHISAYQGPLEGSVGYSKQFGSWQGQEAWWQPMLAGLLDWRLPLAVALLLGSLVMYAVGSWLRARSRGMTFSVLQWVLAFGVVVILAAIAMPNLLPSHLTCGNPRRYAADAKAAVTQAIVYAHDRGVYPTSMSVLRSAGYANVPDTDPWGKPYVLDPVLTSGAKPRDNDDVCLQPGGLWDRCL